MKPNEIAEKIRNFKGVTRKNRIRDLDSILPQGNFKRIIAAEGEDAAVIDCGLSEEYILFAADGIMEELVRQDQFLAGYFGVLVNVNDIAAMGGRQTAMVDIISCASNENLKRLLEGINEGINRFGVPIVGGHTHPDGTEDSLGISIIGTVKKDSIVKSSTVQQGDDIVFVGDLEGRYPESIPYAWETTLSRDKKTVKEQLECAAIVGEKHLVNQGKDISNPGIIGTLGMMLEVSGKGATIDLDSIPMPKNCNDYAHWILSYLGSGFVYSCDSTNSQKIIDLFSKAGCNGQVIGKANDSPYLEIVSENKKVTVFDFSKEIITGFNPRIKK